MATTTERLIPWALRLAWIAVLVAGGAAIDGAVEDAASRTSDLARYGAFSGWVIGVGTMAVPAVVTLTAARIVVPIGVVAAITTVVAGTDTASAAAFVAMSLVAVAIAFAADLGRVFVQASAYGDEDRHLLRPPVAYAIATVATWSVWAIALVIAPLALSSGRWIGGVGAAVVAIGGLVLGWPRWHRLSRRWFVVLPIGIVVHDHVVLAETLMLRRQDLSTIRLAPARTEAADLTGPAAGHAVEIVTTEPVTAIFAATPKVPHGKAIHVRAALVAPSRPGRALSSAGERRLPVG